MSTIRLMNACNYYAGFLNQVYLENPQLARCSYSEQYVRIMEKCFGRADLWKRHLESTGHFEVMEVVPNAEPMQKAWAQEAGRNVDLNRWLFEVLLAQIATWKPDVLFCGVHGLTGDRVQELKKRRPFLRLVGAYAGTGDLQPDFFRGYDFVVTCLESSTAYYSRLGMRAYCFRHGFEPTILQKVQLGPYKLPLTFIGQVSLGMGAHNERLRILRQLAVKVPLVWHGEPLPNLKDWCRSVRRSLTQGHVAYALSLAARYPWSRVLNRVNRGPVYGLAMYQALADSMITVNLHIDSAGPAAVNMRLFEATGMGTCLVTDWKENLARRFEIDREVVTFRTTEELVEKVRYLCDHPRERDAIASAGQRRTLRDYRLGDQVKQLGATLQQWLRAAPAVR